MTRVLVLRSPGERVAVRFPVRPASVGAALVVLLLVLAAVSLAVGEYHLTLLQVLDTLAGNPPEKLAHFFVVERRLPRAVAAMVVGGCLGLGGALFQRLTRNPLGSPDIIGISGGASAGAALVMLVFGGGMTQVSLGALIGGLVAAALILGLTARSGLRGHSFVLVGVAIASLSGAVVSYLLSRVFVASAVTAQTWLVGTLQGRGWPELAPTAAGLAILIPVIAAVGRHLPALDLGDDSARALGVPVDAVRWTLLGAGTLVVALGVATAGPIAFVALVAPHAARRIAGGASLTLSALVGAALLLGADLIAQYAFGSPIPVGVVTVILGGLFFLGILWGGRRGRV